MLHRAARLTRNQDFRLVVRRGRRVGRSRLVVHVLFPETAGAPTTRRSEREKSSEENTAPTRETVESPRVGFVVSKAVGTAVVRHQVARKLRHLMKDRLSLLPAGTLVVVRALPSAAQASSRELGVDLDSALRKLRVLSEPSAGRPG